MGKMGSGRLIHLGGSPPSLTRLRIERASAQLSFIAPVPLKGEGGHTFQAGRLALDCLSEKTHSVICGENGV